jgi:hypothetical protein
MNGDDKGSGLHVRLWNSAKETGSKAARSQGLSFGLLVSCLGVLVTILGFVISGSMEFATLKVQMAVCAQKIDDAAARASEAAKAAQSLAAEQPAKHERVDARLTKLEAVNADHRLTRLETRLGVPMKELP